MAKIRAFISSTYYDLKSIREDLNRFILSLGYEPVLHERGQIPYGSQEGPEEYAYREIEYCDIVISIIGGRFGASATGSENSISQKELRKAFDIGKQIYIFVEKSVGSEYKFYQANKDIKEVRYVSVDDIRIFSFLDEIYAFPKGNPIFLFETITDIEKILRDQWAGLFQRLLSQESTKPQTTLTQELQQSLKTVGQLITFLTEEKSKGNEAIQEILFRNHPLFEAVKKVTKNGYRLYFTNLEEFNDWLPAKGFSPVKEASWDKPDYMEWVKDITTKDKKKGLEILFVKRDLFDLQDRLKPLNPTEWNEEWVRIENRPAEPDEFCDVPF